MWSVPLCPPPGGAGSGFGNALPGIFAPLIIAAFGERETTGYMIVGVGCAVIGFIVCLLHYAMTEERVAVNTSSTPENIKVTDILTCNAASGSVRNFDRGSG